MRILSAWQRRTPDLRGSRKSEIGAGFQFYGTTIIGGTAGHGAVFKVIDKVTN